MFKRQIEKKTLNNLEWHECQFFWSLFPLILLILTFLIALSSAECPFSKWKLILKDLGVPWGDKTI